MAENKSASAFPSFEPDGDIENGLTKREYIATKALAGILAAKSESTFYSPDDVAREAIGMADALIKELNK